MVDARTKLQRGRRTSHRGTHAAPVVPPWDTRLSRAMRYARRRGLSLLVAEDGGHDLGLDVEFVLVVLPAAATVVSVVLR